MIPVENKRILITGGAGFIGSHLCDAFVKNNEVICLDNLSTGNIENIKDLIQKPNFTFIEGDITHFETCLKTSKGIDIVLHQAALGSVSRSIKDPLATNNVNINGFINMLEASKQNQIERFVYAASSSTYGDSKELPKTEDRIGKPLSPYAVTKYVNELYAQVFGQLYGVKTIGLRYFNVFGQRQTPNGEYAAAIPKFIQSFLQDQSPIIYGDGEQSRDFTYVKNVVLANQLAISTENPHAFNQVFNIAYGESNTLNYLIKVLQNLLTKQNPKFKPNPVQYQAERPGDIKHSLASIDKAKKILNYNPKYNLEKGLEEAIQWYYHSLQPEKA